jgi:hypothetical protein
MRFAIVLLAATLCHSQTFTQRGYFETRTYLYPQTAPGDRGHVIAESLLHYETAWRATPELRIAGAIDAQTDTHRETERSLHLSWLDREIQRPALAIRRLSAAWSHGPLTIEVGRQLVRWGKADILNPTDRFAPRDFLNVVHNEYLPVTAARVTYGNQADSIDFVAVPLFTPSRTPLLNQRWGIAPVGIPIVEEASRFPGGTQMGARWNHIGKAAEFSLSAFDGFQHLPLVDAQLSGAPQPVLKLQRFYPRLRTYGGDLAIPLPLVTLKTEAAYFDTRYPAAARYVLYVIQLERQTGEWSLVGGYAGQVVTRAADTPAFDAERGLTRALLGRAAYTIDTNRTAAFEAAVRQNGRGASLRLEYSQAFGQHWRATAGFAVIRGSDGDFLGQYRRNSYGNVEFRYSF